MTMLSSAEFPRSSAVLVSGSSVASLEGVNAEPPLPAFASALATFACVRDACWSVGASLRTVKLLRKSSIPFRSASCVWSIGAPIGVLLVLVPGVVEAEEKES
jgi:hypothetical protein